MSFSATPTGFQATLVDNAIGWMVTVDREYYSELLDGLEDALATGSGTWKELKKGKGYQKRKEAIKKGAGQDDY